MRISGNADAAITALIAQPVALLSPVWITGFLSFGLMALLYLVTEELLVNTIRYGYPEGAREASIEVSLWADAYHAQLVLRDNGIAFNPLEAAEREEDKVGGWGIPLIKTLMDQFDYQRIGEINEITVVRREREN